MAIFSGPEIVNNGLVFHYDMGNTVKSWKGAPTTNQCANGEGVYTSGSVPGFWGREQAFGGIEPSGQTSGIDAYGYGYFQFTILGTTTLSNRLLISPVMYYNSEAAVTAGTTYTFSYNIDNVSNYGYGIQATYLWYDSSNTFLSVTNGAVYSTISGWSRKTDTVTAPVNAAKVTTRFDFNGYSTIGTVLNFTLRLGGIQWEASAFQTPYVRTTNGIASRSNAQSILDLTGINTVTATSLTYASDGTFSFNGSSNRLNPPINHSYLNSSALEVVFRSTSHGSGKKTIFGYRHNQGYSAPTIGSLYLDGNNLSASVITASQVYRVVTAALSISTNTFYHVVLNKNTTTGLLEIYVNGVLRGSQTFDAATYGQWTSAGQFIGENFLDIGKSTNMDAGQGWATDYFSGTIPVAKVYNRVLSAAEIQQNFEATRGRYGI